MILLPLLPTFILFPLASTVVIPSPLKSSYQSIAGQRAINLDVNVRLLTVLALQQSVSMKCVIRAKLFPRRLATNMYDVASR